MSGTRFMAEPPKNSGLRTFTGTTSLSESFSAEIRARSEQAAIDGKWKSFVSFTLPLVDSTDIADSVARFKMQTDLFALHRLDCPCVFHNAENISPIDITRLGLADDGDWSETLSNDAFNLTTEKLAGRSRKALERSRESGLQAVTLAPSNTRSAFAKLLQLFFSFRIDNWHEDVESSYISSTSSDGEAIRNTALGVPGLLVDVHTRKPGLQVLVTPLHFTSFATIFGTALSTPVAGYLQPGGYIFGAQRGKSHPVFEVLPVGISAQSRTVHLVRS